MGFISGFKGLKCTVVKFVLNTTENKPTRYSVLHFAKQSSDLYSLYKMPFKCGAKRAV